MAIENAATGPFMGLVPYAEEDARFFFGREEESQLLIANLMSSRLTLLYGPSGVGKSSLLRAGVAHRLNASVARSLQEHRPLEPIAIVFSSWRDDPLEGLCQEIQLSLARALGSEELEPASPSAADFVENLQRWADRVGTDLIIILDQFEDYFLYHGHEDGSGTFATEVPRAIRSADLPAKFLLSIREDTLAKLDRFEGRVPGIFDNYIRIDHLDREAGRAAIERPIAHYNRLHGNVESVSIEPALVESVLEQVKIGCLVLGETGRGVIVDDLTAQNDSDFQIETPYLQLVMTRLWDDAVCGRVGDHFALRLESLHRLGNADRIVRTHLDGVMGALPAAERDVAAHLFHFLVTPSGTKIAHSAQDLADYARLTVGDVTPVLERLAGPGVRILRPVTSALGQRYEIFHDVLAAAILDWRTRHVNEDERKLTDARLARERRRAGLLCGGLVASLILLVAVVGLAAFGFERSAEATRAHRMALSRELAANAIAQLGANPDLSLLLAAEAGSVAPTIQAEDALRTALLDPVRLVFQGNSGRVGALAFSPDGRTLVTGDQYGTAILWDASTGQNELVIGHYGREITGAAFSPDGARVAIASDDGITRLWDSTSRQTLEVRGSRIAGRAAFSPDGMRVATVNGTAAYIWAADSGDPVLELSGHHGTVTAAAFSPDGSILATGSLDGTARVWDLSNGSTPLAELDATRSGVTTLAFSPDGRQLATGRDDGTVQVWDPRTGRSFAQLAAHGAGVSTVSFSADGSALLTAAKDGTAKVWGAATGRRVADMVGHTGAITAATFGPDGRVVATASVDGTARIWAVDDGKMLTVMRGHGDRVTGVDFRPDGSLLATVGNDGSARLWDVEVVKTLVTLQGHQGWVTGVAISPDGDRVLSTSLDGTARIWQSGDGRLVADLIGHHGLVSDAKFSADAKLAITTSDDGTARVWSTKDGTAVSVLAGHKGRVNSGAFGPDGRIAATVGDDGFARMWDVRTGRELGHFRSNSDPVLAVGFNQDGTRIVTAGKDRAARIWDTSSGHLVAELVGHNGPVTSAVFSKDDRLVLTGSDDAAARVWDVASGRSLELRGHTAPITSATFSSDGRLVATGSDDTTARVWELHSGQVLAHLRGHSRSVNATAFSPDSRFVVTASDDETAQVWVARTGQNLATLTGHDRGVTDVKFAPDGRRIVTTSQDGTLRIFKCDVCGSMEHLLTLVHARVPRELNPEERARYLGDTITSGPSARP